ncbi:MAG: GNAT family N-acetyltransferase [Candidatus Hodarchaeales archaeon]|jgi:GNAT superfamily N-acetyltransferase
MVSTNTVIIKAMKRADITFGLYLTNDIEQWNYTTGDFQRLLDFASNGCFIAEIEGKNVGIVTTTPYTHTAWIGTLIVEPIHRNKGIGKLLMQHAIQYLYESGIETIKLDAVSKAVPLYKNLGFEEIFKSLRFIGTGIKTESRGVRKLVKKDMPEVLALDHFYTGLNREKVLYRIYNDFPNTSFVLRQDELIIGYIMVKKAVSLYKIGPWICNPSHPNAASKLLAVVLDLAKDERIWVGVSDKNEKSIKLLLNNGFEQQPSSTRMIWGRKQSLETNRGIFGIGSPEKG